MKKCNKCGLLKGYSDYQKCKANRDELQIYCRSCRNEAHKVYKSKLPKGYNKKYAHRHYKKLTDFYRLHKDRVFKRGAND